MSTKPTSPLQVRVTPEAREWVEGITSNYGVSQTQLVQAALDYLRETPTAAARVLRRAGVTVGLGGGA